MGAVRDGYQSVRAMIEYRRRLENLVPSRWACASTTAQVRMKISPRVVSICLVICVVAALIVAFSLYPGWMFFDSATQWGWARQIANKGLPDSLKTYIVTSHWPIFNTLLKVPFYWLTGEAGFYIFVQAVLFNLSLYLVGAAILGRKSQWLVVYTLVMVLSPISLNYSVFQSSDTIVALCALTAIAMVIDHELGFTRRATLLILAVLIMSWVRYNALPASVFLLCVFFWVTGQRLGRARSVLGLLATLVFLGGSVAALRAYEHNGYMMDSAAGGVELRLIDASFHTRDPVVHRLVDPLKADSPALRDEFPAECYATGWCPAMQAIPRTHLSTSKYMHAYVRLLTHHPLVFVATNYRFGLYVLGIKAPLEPTQLWRPDVLAPFPSARMTFNGQRLAYFRALESTLGALGSLPARAGIVCLLGLIAGWLLRRRGLVAGFLLLAIGYLGPLLLLAGTNNFRYTFPVTAVAAAVIVAACCVYARYVGTSLARRYCPTPERSVDRVAP